MDKEYDLKESESVVGQLYPILIDAEGRVIDGLHRLEEDENWRVETRENINTPYKYGVARLVANFNRREMYAPEIKLLVNDLAEVMYVEGLRAPTIGQKITTDVGWKDSKTVNRYLDRKYKQIEMDYSDKKGGSEPPSSRPELSYTLADAKNEIGKEKVDSVIAQVREELQRDPEFVIDVLKTAPVVLTERIKSPVISGGFYRPIFDKKQTEKLTRIIDSTEKRLGEIGSRPKVIERKRLIESLRALRVMEGLQHNIYLPDHDTKIVIDCDGDLIDFGYAIQYVYTKIEEGYGED